MRLCTLQELWRDESRGTGCGFDAQRVWTATPCGGGYYTAAGSTVHSGSFPTECTPAEDDATVRCCADTCLRTGGWVLE
jgi:hypothetical protein